MKGKPIGQIFVELDLSTDAYTKKEREVLKGATTTSLEIEKNWRTLGSHSDKIYDAMRQQATNSFNAIANSSKSSAAEIIRAEEAKNAKIKKINEQQYGQHVSFTERLKKNWQEVAAAAYLAYKAFQTGKEMITASLAMERISMSMNAVADNTTLAAREIQYIREESERLGLVFNDATVEYIKFAAAAKNTSIEGEATRKIFTGMSEAITALKLSTMDANLIYMAMTQMISKGKVSMEELRRQMGERLPGAIRLAAEGMGMSTMELIKNIEAGKVMAYDLLPKLAEKLHETYGQAALQAAQGGQAAINRFNNAVFETKAAIGDSLMPVLTDVLSLIKQTLPYITAFVGGIKILAVEAAAWFDSLWLDDPNKVGMSYAEQLAMIEKVKEEAQIAVVNQMTPGISSAKTPAELALEQTKIENAKKREIVDPTSKEKVRAAKDEADKILKIQQNANMAIAKHREDAIKEYENLLINETDFALTENERQIAQIERQEQDKLWKINVMLQEETISWEQYEKAKAGITTNAAKARLTNETENAKRIAGINYNLIQDIMGMEQTAFDLRMTQIEAERNKYIADGGDIVHAAKWAANEQTKALIKYGQESENVTDGIKAAYLDLYQKQVTWGKAGFTMMNKTFQAGATAWGDTYYSVIVGDINNLQDIWDSTWQGMLRSFTDILGQMTMQWGMSKVGSLFGTGGTVTIDEVLNGNESAAWGYTKTASGEIANSIMQSSDEFANKVESSSSLWQIATKESAGLFGEQIGLAGQQFTNILGSGITSIFGAMGIGVALGGGIGGNMTGALIGSLAGFALLGPLGAIGGGIIGGFFHEGGVFESGHVVPYASGGIVNQPTIFPMASGNIGLMGEKGYEAIMPLARTKSGDLGVKVEGGRGSKIIHYHYNTFKINGSVVTEKELVRKLIPQIKQAQKEGAH